MPEAFAEYSDILDEVKDAVARVTINRSDQLNAFIPHAVRRAGADNQVDPGFFAFGEQAEGSQASLEKRRPDVAPWR